MEGDDLHAQEHCNDYFHDTKLEMDGYFSRVPLCEEYLLVLQGHLLLMNI